MNIGRRFTFELPEDLVLELPEGDTPERSALRIAIALYLRDFGPDGYTEEEFLDYARAHLEAERLRLKPRQFNPCLSVSFPCQS